MTSRLRLVHVLSENWTLTSPRDLRALVRMAQEAEDAGFDTVMVSEHVVLGRCGGSHAEPARLRAPRQPGSGDAVAQFAGPPLRGRVRHDDAAARGGRDH